MKQKKKSDVAVLMDYAGGYKRLTFLGLALSAVSMLLSMIPYICIWLAARDLIAVAPGEASRMMKDFAEAGMETRVSVIGEVAEKSDKLIRLR